MAALYEKALLFKNNWNNVEEITNSNLKVSVVIPVYHPRYLKEVLEHLSKLDNIYEVITVFDGKDDDYKEIVSNYNFKLTVVQHNKNLNAPAANNTGAIYASGDVILFLDQDMILSPSFIPKALSLLEKNDKNAIVLGFRETVDFENILTYDNWQEGNFDDDWRIKTTINDNYLDLTVACCGSSHNNCDKDSPLRILNISNYFRNLGINPENTIAFWDLASMVISHTLLIPRNKFLTIGGYPEWIKGWGGEDIALGYLAICNHMYIIPVDVCSYHIKHEPHSGSEEKKWNEMRENLKKYKTWSHTIEKFPVIDENECLKRSRILYKK